MSLVLPVMAQLHWRNSAIALKHAAQPWAYGRRGPLSLLTLELRIPGSVRSPAIGVPSRSANLPWPVEYVVPDGLWAPLPLAPCSTKWLVQLLREKSGHASKNLVDRLRSRVVHSARPSGSNASGLECVRSIRSKTPRPSQVQICHAHGGQALHREFEREISAIGPIGPIGSRTHVRTVLTDAGSKSTPKSGMRPSMWPTSTFD